MRIIFTFDEIEATKGLVINLVAACDKVERSLADRLFGKTAKIDTSLSVEELLAILSDEHPSVIKVDYEQRRAVFTYHPKTVVQIATESADLIDTLSSLASGIYAICNTYFAKLKKDIGRIKAATKDLYPHH